MRAKSSCGCLGAGMIRGAVLALTGGFAFSAAAFVPVQPSLAELYLSLDDVGYEAPVAQAAAPSCDPVDVALAGKIRASLLADAGLSGYARTVEIAAQDGRVTLRGVVATVAEKKAVCRLAARAAGPANLTDLLEIAK